jgi:hypothetical protein
MFAIDAGSNEQFGYTDGGVGRGEPYTVPDYTMMRVLLVGENSGINLKMRLGGAILLDDHLVGHPSGEKAVEVVVGG